MRGQGTDTRGDPEKRQSWPKTKITIELRPASLPKHGSGFDLVIAIVILAAAGVVPLDALVNVVSIAELGLDGSLWPVPGVLPAILTSAADGIDTAVVPGQTAMRRNWPPGIRVVAADSLADVIAWLQGGSPPRQGNQRPDGGPSSHLSQEQYRPDLAEVLGQPQARMAAGVCAAEGHNLSLLGPSDAGKTVLAERLPTILPELESEAALEATALHSLAGALPERVRLLTAPSFQAPHHTASIAAMVGGGSGILRPGAASLTHHGVLFLDDAPDFSRDALEALRQPLEIGQATIARSQLQAAFPAKFMLVLAAQPCPYLTAACECTPADRRRYLHRLPRSLVDQIDIKVRMEPANRPGMLVDRQAAESSEVVARRVTAPRERTAYRLRGTPWRVNAEVPGAELRQCFAPSAVRCDP